jgi:hypothetical protein
LSLNGGTWRHLHPCLWTSEYLTNVIRDSLIKLISLFLRDFGKVKVRLQEEKRYKGLEVGCGIP